MVKLKTAMKQLIGASSDVKEHATQTALPRRKAAAADAAAVAAAAAAAAAVAPEITAAMKRLESLFAPPRGREEIVEAPSAAPAQQQPLAAPVPFAFLLLVASPSPPPSPSPSPSLSPSPSSSRSPPPHPSPSPPPSPSPFSIPVPLPLPRRPPRPRPGLRLRLNPPPPSPGQFCQWKSRRSSVTAKERALRAYGRAQCLPSGRAHTSPQILPGFDGRSQEFQQLRRHASSGFVAGMHKQPGLDAPAAVRLRLSAANHKGAPPLGRHPTVAPARSSRRASPAIWGPRQRNRGAVSSQPALTTVSVAPSGDEWFYLPGGWSEVMGESL